MLLITALFTKYCNHLFSCVSPYLNCSWFSVSKPNSNFSSPPSYSPSHSLSIPQTSLLLYFLLRRNHLFTQFFNTSSDNILHLQSELISTHSTFTQIFMITCTNLRYTVIIASHANLAINHELIKGTRLLPFHQYVI